jgi:hypothetical protein
MKSDVGCVAEPNKYNCKAEALLVHTAPCSATHPHPFLPLFPAPFLVQFLSVLLVPFGEFIFLFFRKFISDWFGLRDNTSSDLPRAPRGRLTSTVLLQLFLHG